jgi:two-component system sensor histidine kinase/response regulator
VAPSDHGSYLGNIVIVDDTLANLRVLSKMLTERGYLVRCIPSAEMALTAIWSELPDLVLLDIMMPGMDGYELCRRLKGDDRTRDVPVVFMSALDEVTDKVKAFSAGGVDYVTKPFQVEEVLARVDAHVTLNLLKERLEQQVIAMGKVNRGLQEANSELDAFAHTVAHDLKNPLANVLMVVEIIRRLAATNGQQELPDEVLATLDASARKAVNIVDELLLLASVRREQVQRGPLDMGEIVAQAQQRLGWMIDDYEGEIRVADTWPTAFGYASWVEEIWVNYLSNGLKYGGRPPRLLLGATAQEKGMIRFWVRDNGPGIPVQMQESLFAEFTRIERTRASGHGLGLSIVKRIADKLGGEVGVESAEAEGSLFYFALPGANGWAEELNSQRQYT